MNFIELTTLDGSKFIGNIHLLKKVYETSDGKTALVGWNNIDHTYVRESYEKVVEKINARLAGVNRLK